MATNKQIFIPYIIKSRTNAIHIQTPPPHPPPPFNKIEDDNCQITTKEIHTDQLKEFDLPEVFKTRICDHYKKQDQLKVKK